MSTLHKRPPSVEMLQYFNNEYTDLFDTIEDEVLNNFTTEVLHDVFPATLPLGEWSYKMSNNGSVVHGEFGIFVYPASGNQLCDDPAYGKVHHISLEDLVDLDVLQEDIFDSLDMLLNNIRKCGLSIDNNAMDAGKEIIY